MQPTFEIKVFVSCPGDVTQEKDMIKAICDTLNNTLMATQSAYRLKVLDFRDIVAPISGRAQEEINVRFSEYDIYIGILWMRFGSPTGATDPNTGKEYESGTQEEFNTARRMYEEAGKVNMYLFIRDIGSPQGVAALEQMLKVAKFREEVQHLGWVNSFPNKQESVEFNNKIHQILNEWVRNAENRERISDKKTYLGSVATSAGLRFTEVTKFVTKVPAHSVSIPRTLYPFEKDNGALLKLFGTKEEKNLSELVEQHKRLVVLGNAGSGKSTELGILAHFYAKENTPFIPIYQRLNTYVDESIEDFLPCGWKEVPENICLVILDGLDEVQPANFNTVVRKLQSFSERYPELRIVVSCRTNFYQFPDSSTGGTLGGFEVYFLNDIQSGSIGDYATEEYSIDPKAFIKEAYNEGLDELSRQPFFLNILLAEFKKRGNLKIDKVKLMETFISQRIEFDQSHFKSTVQLKEKKPHIIQLLNKLALAMEYLGRNFVTYDELQKLLPDVANIELIKYSTAFKSFEAEPDKWGFEHNNLQEFLAANALTHLTIEEIKSFISFDHKKIKPSWLNTLFFLMSILEETKRKELIDWILQIDPEVLVKVEPDKVDVKDRFQIFKHIFEQYKGQGVWLRSNKFSLTELAGFIPAGSGNAYLLEQLRNKDNNRVVKLNAVGILSLQKLGSTQLADTKAQLLEFIEENPNDQYIFHNTTSALASLGIADKAVIEHLLGIFGYRKNQYFRSGFYQMITNSNLVDEYFEYILEGLTIPEEGDDREPVHLLDEDMLIKSALTGELKSGSVFRLWKVFENSYSREMTGYHDKHEILRNLVEKSIRLYRSEKNIYPAVLEIFKEYGRTSGEAMADIIAQFFVKSKTDLDVFKDVFFDSTLGDYEKSILYKPLLSTQAVDFVLTEHAGHNLTNKDVMEFYRSAKWFVRGIDKETILDYFTAQLHEKTSLLQDHVEIDYQQQRIEQLHEETGLYFSISKFRGLLVTFFDNLQIQKIDWDTLWKHNRFDSKTEHTLPEAVFDLLIDFTRNKNTVTLQRALEFIDNTEAFQGYLFRELKEKMSSNPEIVLTSEQEQLLTAWVNKKVESIDIADAIRISKHNPNSFSYDKTVMTLWYFISKFKIKIQLDKLLDFTVYDELRSHSEYSLDFGVLEELAGTEQVKIRVSENLAKGITYNPAWKNNAMYAIENSIAIAYGTLLSGIADYGKSSYARNYVLKQYAAKTKDFVGINELLAKIEQDEIRWTIIEILSNEEEFGKVISGYLQRLLNSDSEQIPEKLKAAQYLTKIGNIEGTEFYLQHLLQNEDSAIDYYYQATYLRSIKDKKFIPQLIEILEMANRPKMLQDDFNRLESYISDSLYAIGLISEENLEEVKKALLDFIAKNKDSIKNVNFYHPMIDRMVYQFYLAKSQSATIDDAIIEIQKIS